MIEDVKKSITDFVETRTKNPFFASALISWLVMNRVAVYTAITYDNSLPLLQRVSTISKMFNRYQIPLPYFKECDYLNGFYLSIWIAAAIGFMVMILYNKLSGYTKYVYIWVNKGTVEFLQSIDDGNWVKKSQYADEKKKSEMLSRELDELKEKIEKNDKRHTNMVDGLNSLLAKRNEEKSTIEQDLLDANNKLTHYKTEDERFKVIFAQYGDGEKTFEVTTKVEKELDSIGQLGVSNKTFLIDPAPYRVKQLAVEYSFKNEVRKITLIEEQILHLENGILKSQDTDKSKEKKNYFEQYSTVLDIIEGTWKVQKTGSTNLNDVYFMTFDRAGNYLINSISQGGYINAHFNVPDNSKSIRLNLISSNGIPKETYFLEVKSKNELIGKDDDNELFRFEKS